MSSKAIQTRSRVIQGEIVDVTLARTEVMPAMRPLAPGRPVQGETQIVPSWTKRRATETLSGERPPNWWEPQADEDWRQKVWVGLAPGYRNRLLAQRAGAAFSVRPPEATDQVIIWSQYHALKALATRLDAGIGTERERVGFEAALLEYNANFERVLAAQRKALPG